MDSNTCSGFLLAPGNQPLMLIQRKTEITMHGDTFRAHARKFNHELVLRTVRMRTESEATIVLYTLHVRMMYNEKRALLAVHAHEKQWSTSIYTPCAYTVRMRPCARNVTTCSVRACARTANALDVFGAVRIY